MSSRQLARDMHVELQARMHAKSSRREAAKASKEYKSQERAIMKLLREGDTEKALQKAKMLITMQNIARRMDGIADMAELSAAQIKANNSMNRMTHMMANSSRTMAVAQKNMTPEKTLQTLEVLRTQNEEYNMSSNIYQEAMAHSTDGQASEDEAHQLLGRLADEAGVELNMALSARAPATAEPATAATTEPTAEEEERLQQRLRALRE